MPPNLDGAGAPQVCDLTVVVPTWRRSSDLHTCLSALALQAPCPAQVIVVGRATDVDALNVVCSHRDSFDGRLEWAEVVEPGIVPPVRLGLDRSRSGVVAFLDDDAEPLPGWSAAVMRRMSDERVGVVGGPALEEFVARKIHADVGKFRWYGRYVGNISAVEGRTLDVDAVRECNWAWRRALMTSIEFDPVFQSDDSSMYGADLCLQAAERGFRIVHDQDVRVVHRPGWRDQELEREDAARRAFSYSRNFTYMILRRSRWRRRIPFLIWTALIGERQAHGLVRFILALPSGPRSAAAVGWASVRGKTIGAYFALTRRRLRDAAK